MVGGEELSDAEREKLLRLCRQRLDAFRMQRGEEVGCLLTQKLRLRVPRQPPWPANFIVAGQAVMHDFTALLAMAMRQPEPKSC